MEHLQWQELMLVQVVKQKVQKLHPTVLYEDNRKVGRRTLECSLLDEEESADP
jgi:hypothetical protein